MTGIPLGEVTQKCWDGMFSFMDEVLQAIDDRTQTRQSFSTVQFCVSVMVPLVIFSAAFILLSFNSRAPQVRLGGRL